MEHCSLLKTNKLNDGLSIFADLLNRPCDEICRSPPTPSGPRNFKRDLPSKSAIGHLKSGKAPDADNIHSEMLKADPNVCSEILLPIIQEAWESGDTPTNWKDGLIIKLPKKRDLSICKN